MRHRQPFKGQRLHEGLVQLHSRPVLAPGSSSLPSPLITTPITLMVLVRAELFRDGSENMDGVPVAGRLLEGCEPRTPTAVIVPQGVTSDTGRVIGLAGCRGYRRRATARPPRSSSPGALWRSPSGRASQSPRHRVASAARRPEITPNGASFLDDHRTARVLRHRVRIEKRDHLVGGSATLRGHVLVDAVSVETSGGHLPLCRAAGRREKV